jgi:DNA-directed RNA polymerase subunit RPC12/RpoP
MTKTDAKEATCTEAGNVEYYTCSVCGKNFADEAGETVLENVVIAAKGHTMTKTDAKEATCTEAGNVEYYTCSVCGKNFADAEGKTELDNVVIPADGHTLTKVEAKESTFEEEGNNEYYICHCGAAFKDAEGTIPTTVEAETLPKKDYVKGDINSDGRVSIADAVAILRVASGETELPATYNLLAADVSEEGDTETMQINTADVILVMQHIVGKVKEL